MLIQISFPVEAKCLLKEGQSVDFESEFLEHGEDFDVEVQVAKKLEVAKDKIFSYLLKFVGENVKKGDILARKKTLFSQKNIVSDFQGVIKEINHTKGSLIIKVEDEKKKKFSAYFKGEVETISKDYLKLKVGSGFSASLKKAASDFGGKVLYLKEKDPNISEGLVKNQICLIESINEYNLTKLEALGSAGILTLREMPETASLPSAQIEQIEDFKKALEKKFTYCLIDIKSSKIFFYQ